MGTMYWPCAEVLCAAAALGQGRPLPAEPALRGELKELLKGAVRRCREAGVPDSEIAEARYALVALIDECVLRSTAWSGWSDWSTNTLQGEMFGRVDAGEAFFDRMRALAKREPLPPAHEIYALCIALGFTGGKSGAGRAQSPKEVLESACARTSPLKGLALSPHPAPSDFRQPRPRRQPAVLGLALACALVVALGFAALEGGLSRTVRAAADSLPATAPE